jgi:hypothetical protein
MAELKLKPTDKPLSAAELAMEAQITAADVGRAVARWQRRMPDLQARLGRVREEIKTNGNP